MKRIFRFPVVLLFVVVACNKTANAQAPVINSITANSSSIQRCEKLELTVNLNAGFTNPYYDDILIRQVADKRTISFNNSADQQLSLAKLVPGVYYLSITDNKGQRYKAIKFIVQ
jgi:hypothetical protein